ASQHIMRAFAPEAIGVVQSARQEAAFADGTDVVALRYEAGDARDRGYAVRNRQAGHDGFLDMSRNPAAKFLRAGRPTTPAVETAARFTTGSEVAKIHQHDSSPLVRGWHSYHVGRRIANTG